MPTAPPSRNAHRLLALAIVSLVVVSCTGGKAGGPGGSPPSGPLLPASATALPQFDLARFKELLAQLHGRPVVVNIWASWCGPCIQEAPHLATISAEFSGRVQFLGVDVLDQRPAAERFIERFGWTYPSVFDPSGGIRTGLGFLGQPVTIVYDAGGRQVFALAGPTTDAQLREQVQKALGP